MSKISFFLIFVMYDIFISIIAVKFWLLNCWTGDNWKIQCSECKSQTRNYSVSWNRSCAQS